MPPKTAGLIEARSPLLLVPTVPLKALATRGSSRLLAQRRRDLLQEHLIASNRHPARRRSFSKASVLVLSCISLRANKLQLTLSTAPSRLALNSLCSSARNCRMTDVAKSVRSMSCTSVSRPPSRGGTPRPTRRRPTRLAPLRRDRARQRRSAPYAVDRYGRLQRRFLLGGPGRTGAKVSPCCRAGACRAVAWSPRHQGRLLPPARALRRLPRLRPRVGGEPPKCPKVAEEVSESCRTSCPWSRTSAQLLPRVAVLGHMLAEVGQS